MPTHLSTTHSGAKEISGLDLPWGAFGENFTTEGLLEEAVHIGDRLRVGSAEVYCHPTTNALL